MNKAEREVLARHLKKQFDAIRTGLAGEVAELKAENVRLRTDLDALLKNKTAEPISVQDGKDGRDGADGLTGQDGKDGRDGRDGIDGIDGKSLTTVDVEPLIEAGIAKAALSYERHANSLLQAAIERIAKPENVTKEQVAILCREQLDVAIKALPKPRDGTDGIDGRDGTPGKDGTPGANGKNGEPGESVDIDDVLPEVMRHVEKALSAIPIPKDGESVTVDDIRPLLASMNAEYALDFEKRMQSAFQAAVDKIPKPKDGKDGVDFTDFEQTLSDDGRMLTTSFGSGDNRKSFTMRVPAIIDVGVWKEGEYEVGDSVTYDGSSWICKTKTKSKPGDYNKDWRLSVRKGRNGKS